MLKTVASLVALSVLGVSASAVSERPPAAPPDRVEEIDQRPPVPERQDGIEKENATEAAKTATALDAGAEGFSIRSANGAYSLRFRGLVQVDSAFFRNDEKVPGADSIFLRRARPILEGTVGKIFDFRVTPDFARGKTVLFDAYVDARFHPLAKVRAGKFKPPVGLERLQSAPNIAFIVRAAPTLLVPNRDVGVQLHGDLRGGFLAYALMASNGTPDGGNVDADTNDGKEFSARVFLHPFRGGHSPRLEGLGFGLAGTHGSDEGTPTATGLGTYKTPGDLTFFSYRGDGTAPATVVADGKRTRWTPQAYLYLGRFGFLAEYVSSTQDVRLDAQAASLTQTAWQGSFTILLTDDTASYRGVDPKKPFEVGKPGRGAVELAVRYSRVDFDEASFPVFADPAKSARRASEMALGANWWMNRHIRLTLNLERTEFEGGAAGGADRETESVVLSRFQVSF
jgi:phosphate-selective porin OprO/OprP